MACSEEEIRWAAQRIREGGLVAFPTETVYGLGANALDAEAVQRIYEAKGRPASSPLIVHVATAAMARELAEDWAPLADKLAARFWPGPLTLVVRRRAVVPDVVTAGLPSVAIRVPAHPVALRLLELAGVPIAAPSANRFMSLSPTTAEHVQMALGDAVDLVLDGGAAQVGIESTVVSLTGEQPVILRPGMISAAELKAVVGVPFALGNAVVSGPAESPGLHARHYAPRTPLYVLGAGDLLPAGRGRVLEMPDSADEYAARLYAALHEADGEGWDWIAVAEPPEGPEWAGIRDRLRRAAVQ